MTETKPKTALDGARRKGYEAAKRGEALTDCPYEDKRGGNYGQVITWSRAFIHAWMEGWHKGYEEKSTTVKD